MYLMGIILVKETINEQNLQERALICNFHFGETMYVYMNNNFIIIIIIIIITIIIITVVVLQHLIVGVAEVIFNSSFNSRNSNS